MQVAKNWNRWWSRGIVLRSSANEETFRCIIQHPDYEYGRKSCRLKIIHPVDCPCVALQVECVKGFRRHLYRPHVPALASQFTPVNPRCVCTPHSLRHATCLDTDLAPCGRFNPARRSGGPEAIGSGCHHLRTVARMQPMASQPLMYLLAIA
jgi:hypothetical protein